MAEECLLVNLCSTVCVKRPAYSSMMVHLTNLLNYIVDSSVLHSIHPRAIHMLYLMRLVSSRNWSVRWRFFELHCSCCSLQVSRLLIALLKILALELHYAVKFVSLWREYVSQTCILVSSNNFHCRVRNQNAWRNWWRDALQGCGCFSSDCEEEIWHVLTVYYPFITWECLSCVYHVTYLSCTWEFPYYLEQTVAVHNCLRNNWGFCLVFQGSLVCLGSLVQLDP